MLNKVVILFSRAGCVLSTYLLSANMFIEVFFKKARFEAILIAEFNVCSLYSFYAICWASQVFNQSSCQGRFQCYLKLV